MNASGLWRDYARRNSSRDRVAESLRVRNADKATSGSSATEVQQVRIPGRIPESARFGSQATRRATMAYLRRGCFTIGTGSMSTERKRSSNGDKKKERKKRTQKRKRGKKEKKRKGKKIWTGQVLFSGPDDI